MVKGGGCVHSRLGDRMDNPLTTWSWKTLGVCCCVLRMTEGLTNPEERGAAADVLACLQSFSYLAGVLKTMGVPLF